MAFGKDSKVIAAVGSFRQVSSQFTKNQVGKKKGGSGVPYFVDQFELPTELTAVRLIPGQYLQDQVIGDEETDPENLQVQQILMPFIKFVDHYDGHNKRGAICSAGPLGNVKTRREPCRGCDIFWATVHRNQNGRLESSRMSRQNKYAFTIFDYSPYHKVPQYDRDNGQIRKNAQGEAYFNWIRCFGQGCDMCRNQNEWKQGHCTHFNTSYTGLQTIRGAEADIGKSCVVCGHENCIISRGWMCGGCGAEVIDMSNTTLKTDEILKITDDPYGCGQCGQKVLLKEVYACGPCTQQGRQGIRAGLFDVDLKIKGVPSTTGKGKTLNIMGWSAPYKLSPEMLALAQPIDLVARYAPMPFEAQVQLFGEVPNQGGRQPQNNGQQHMPPGAPQNGFQPPPQGFVPPMQQGFQPPPGGFAQPQGGFAPSPQGFQPPPQQPAPQAPAPVSNPYANPYAPRT